MVTQIDMDELLRLHNLWTARGGTLGGLKAFYTTDNEKKPIGESIINFCISVAAAVSTTTYWFEPEKYHPFAYLGAGVIVGFLGVYFLDLSRVMLPGVMKSKLRDWLGVKKDDEHE